MGRESGQCNKLQRTRKKSFKMFFAGGDCVSRGGHSGRSSRRVVAPLDLPSVSYGPEAIGHPVIGQPHLDGENLEYISKKVVEGWENACYRETAKEKAKTIPRGRYYHKQVKSDGFED